MAKRLSKWDAETKRLKKLKREPRQRKKRKLPPDYSKMGYPQYLLTKHWKKTRFARLKLDGWFCQNCFKGSDYGLQVHHKTYENLGHEKPEDLITLCRDCHFALHDRGFMGLAEHVDILHWRNGPKQAVRSVAV